MTKVSGRTTVADYEPGDILVWTIEISDPASDTADMMGKAADAHNLGTWSVAPIGLGANTAYFDLLLDRPISSLCLRLIFGSLPRTY